MNQALHLRGATNDDADGIRSLVFGVLEEYGLAASHEGIDADLSDINGSYHKSGGFFDVLIDELGAVVGSVGVCSRGDAESCELRKMYLRPHLRGLGHGKMLLDHAIQKARAMGFRRMELETSSRLTQAINLYRQSGFERFHPAHLADRCDQAWARLI